MAVEAAGSPGDPRDDDGERPPQVVTTSAWSLRTVALVGLFLLAVFYTLKVARPVALPIVLALLVSLLLNPLVRVLSGLRLPRAVAAGLVVLGLLGLLGVAGYQVADPASDWMARAPGDMRRLEWELRQILTPVEKVSEATQSVERLTQMDGDGERSPEVRVEGQSLARKLFQNARQALTTLLLTVILSYFLLAMGETFLRKIVKVMPTLTDKRRAVEIARQLEGDLSAYLATITLINSCLGFAVGLAMWALGMPNPMLWGVMATFLNFIPYLGAIVGVAVVGLVAVLTFDGLVPSLLPPLSYLLLTGIEGYFLTPLIVGRRLTLNPLAILIGLLFWGWLWGIPGALLAVPLLASLKILCDHVDRLQPLGEMLGN